MKQGSKGTKRKPNLPQLTHIPNYSTNSMAPSNTQLPPLTQKHLENLIYRSTTTWANTSMVINYVINYFINLRVIIPNAVLQNLCLDCNILYVQILCLIFPNFLLGHLLLDFNRILQLVPKLIHYILLLKFQFPFGPQYSLAKNTVLNFFNSFNLISGLGEYSGGGR